MPTWEEGVRSGAVRADLPKCRCVVLAVGHCKTNSLSVGRETQKLGAALCREKAGCIAAIPVGNPQVRTSAENQSRGIAGPLCPRSVYQNVTDSSRRARRKRQRPQQLVTARISSRANQQRRPVRRDVQHKYVFKGVGNGGGFTALDRPLFDNPL